MQEFVQSSFLTDQQFEADGRVQLIRNADVPLTKRDLQEKIEKAQKQRILFEKENGVLFAEERKKALYD